MFLWLSLKGKWAALRAQAHNAQRAWVPKDPDAQRGVKTTGHESGHLLWVSGKTAPRETPAVSAARVPCVCFSAPCRQALKVFHCGLVP